MGADVSAFLDAKGHAKLASLNRTLVDGLELSLPGLKETSGDGNGA